MPFEPAPRLYLGYILMLALPLSVALFPRSRWARLAHLQVGPRLDAANLTRGQCLQAAVYFALLGVAAAVAGLVTILVAGRAASDNQSLVALMFGYFLLTLVGFGGALYLVVRAPFRPRILPMVAFPPGSKHLKTYLDPTGYHGALIVERPDRMYMVLLQDIRDRSTAAPEGPFSDLRAAELRALELTGHLFEARKDV